MSELSEAAIPLVTRLRKNRGLFRLLSHEMLAELSEHDHGDDEFQGELLIETIQRAWLFAGNSQHLPVLPRFRAVWKKSGLITSVLLQSLEDWCQQQREERTYQPPVEWNSNAPELLCSKLNELLHGWREAAGIIVFVREDNSADILPAMVLPFVFPDNSRGAAPPACAADGDTVGINLGDSVSLANKAARAAGLIAKDANPPIRLHTLPGACDPEIKGPSGSLPILIAHRFCAANLKVPALRIAASGVLNGQGRLEPNSSLEHEAYSVKRDLLANLGIPKVVLPRSDIAPGGWPCGEDLKTWLNDLAGELCEYRRLEVGENALIDFRHYRETTTHYTGRQWLRQNVDDWFLNNDRGIFLITGRPGIGKTSFVTDWIANNHSVTGEVIHFYYSGRQGLRPAAFQRHIYKSLYIKHCGDPAADPDSPKDEELKVRIKNILDRISEDLSTGQRREVIVVDGLDEAGDESAQIEAVLALPIELPVGFFMLVTCREVEHILAVLRVAPAPVPFFEFELRGNAPENVEDAEKYVLMRAADPSDIEDSAIRTELTANVKQIVAEAGANFLFLQQWIRALKNGLVGLDESHAVLVRTSNRSADGNEQPGLHALYNEFWQRCISGLADADCVKVFRLANILAVARARLSERQWCGAAKFDGPEFQVYSRRLHQFLETMRGESSSEDDSSVIHYQYYHWSFAEFLSSQIGFDGQGAADSLIDYFLEKSELDGHWEPYAIRYLPEHLITIRRWDGLEALLTDISFLEAKNESGLTFELAEDFSLAATAVPATRPQQKILRLLQEALRRDINFIARHSTDYPVALFQCLWNSCWWYDCPEVVHHYTDDYRPSKAPLLSALLAKWRAKKEDGASGEIWMRSLRPPLIRLDSSQLLMLSGHEGMVSSISVSPDGFRIASGSHDSSVRVWNATSGRHLLTLCGHECLVQNVSFVAGGKLIASGSSDSIRFWNTLSGAEEFVMSGGDRRIQTVGFSADGRYVVFGIRTNTFQFCDLLSHRELEITDANASWGFAAFEFSPDGNRLAAASDFSVRLWELQSGRELLEIEQRVKCIAFSADGEFIAAGSADKSARIWEVRNGYQVCACFGHESVVTDISFSPNGASIVTSSHDGSIRVWNAQTGLQKLLLRGHEFHVSSVAFIDERRIVSGSADGTLRVWDTQKDCPTPKLRGHQGFLNTLLFSQDGQRLASGACDKTVRVWNAENGRELLVLRGHEKEVSAVAFSPDNKRIASASADETVRVWDRITGAQLLAFRSHESAKRSVVEFSPDGRVIALGGRGLGLWSADTGGELRLLRGHTERIQHVEFSSAGALLLSRCEKSIRVWRVRSGAELFALHNSEISGAAFCADGEAIIVEFNNGDAQRWELRNGQRNEQRPERAKMHAEATDLSETNVIESTGGTVIARLPRPLLGIVGHLPTLTWAGSSVGGHIRLFVLEQFGNRVAANSSNSLEEEPADGQRSEPQPAKGGFGKIIRR